MLEQLYEACFKQVYSYALSLCRDRETAEEITQDAFFRAMKAGKNAEFRGNSDAVTWLCSIVKHRYYDEIRARKYSGDLPPDTDSGADVAGDAVRGEMSFRIHTVLHTLDEPYKEVFQLRVFGELSFADIGRLFGKTEAWARVTYHRAKLKIRERMDETDGSM